MIYLASPYSHPDAAVRQSRYEAACEAAGVLARHGYHVFSPIAHSHGIALHGGTGGSWEDWERQDLVMLAKASAFVLLPLEGWKESHGVRVEAEHAARQGLPMLVMEDWGPFDGGRSGLRGHTVQMRRWWNWSHHPTSEAIQTWASLIDPPPYADDPLESSRLPRRITPVFP